MDDTDKSLAAMTDEQLVARAQVDLEAFGEIVHRHQDFVYGAVLRIVRNPVMAEDVAQDSFIRAYRAIGGFRGEAAVRSWLYRIATNLAFNAVQRRKEFPAKEMPEGAAEPGPHTEVMISELGGALREAIDRLPEELREPLVLREYRSLSYQEIADHIGLPLNTVRTRILRARRALAEDMESWR